MAETTYSDALRQPNQLVREYGAFLKSQGRNDPRPIDQLTVDLGRQLQEEGRLDEYFDRYPDFKQHYEVFAPSFEPTLGEKAASGLRRAAGTFVAEIPAGTMEGLAVAGSTLTGSEKPVAETALYRGAQAVREKTQEWFPVDEQVAGDFWWDQVPGAIGSFGAFIIGSIATGAVVGATVRGAGALGATAKAAQSLDAASDALKVSQAARKGAMAFSMGAATTGGIGQAYTEANQFGTTEEDARLAGLLGAGAGAMQVFPVMRAFDRFNKGSAGALEREFANWMVRKGGAEKVAQATAGGIAGAIEEFALESAGQATFNAIARQIYDEDRDYLLGVAEAGGAGGIAGFLANAMLSSIGGGKSISAIKRGEDPATAPEAEPGSADRMPPADEFSAVAKGEKKAHPIVEKVTSMTPEEGLRRFDELTAKAKRTTEETQEWRQLHKDERVQAQVQAREEREREVLDREPTEATVPEQPAIQAEMSAGPVDTPVSQEQAVAPSVAPPAAQPPPAPPEAAVEAPDTVDTPDAPDPIPGAPAEFLGFQERPSGSPLELWNLTAPLGDRPMGSTVSRRTIEELMAAQEPEQVAEETPTPETPKLTFDPRPFQTDLGGVVTTITGDHQVTAMLTEGALDKEGNRAKSRNYLVMERDGQVFALPVVKENRKGNLPFRADGTGRYTEPTLAALGGGRLIGLKSDKGSPARHAAVVDLLESGFTQRAIVQFDNPGTQPAIFESGEAFTQALPGQSENAARPEMVYGEEAMAAAESGMAQEQQQQSMREPDSVAPPTLEQQTDRVMGAYIEATDSGMEGAALAEAVAAAIDPESTPDFYQRIVQAEDMPAEISAIIQEVENERLTATNQGSTAGQEGLAGVEAQAGAQQRAAIDTGTGGRRLRGPTARNLVKLIKGNDGRADLSLTSHIYGVIQNPSANPSVRNAADRTLAWLAESASESGQEVEQFLGTIQSAYDRAAGDAESFAELVNSERSRLGDPATGIERGAVSDSVRSRPDTEGTNPPRRPMTMENRQQFETVVDRLRNGGINVRQLAQDVDAVDAFLQRQNASVGVHQDQRAYAITLVMEDVVNANYTNLVGVIHEAAHIAVDDTLGRLDPQMQAAAFRAVSAFSSETFQNTPEPGTYYSNPEERLAEHLGRKLADEGFGAQSASLGQRIIRLVKELYYRIALSIQRGIYGPENVSGDLALRWTENHLRRMLGGDLDGPMQNLLKFIGADYRASPGMQAQSFNRVENNTPIDRFDPVAERFTQPEIVIEDGESAAFSMRFVNPPVRMRPETATDVETGTGIDGEESRARINVVMARDANDFITREYERVSEEYKLPYSLETWRKMWTRQNPDGVIQNSENTAAGVSETTKDDLNEAELAEAERLTEAAFRQMTVTLSRTTDTQRTGLDQETERLIKGKQTADELHNDLNNMDVQVQAAKDSFRVLLRTYLNAIEGGQSMGEQRAEIGVIHQVIQQVERLGSNDPIPASYIPAINKWFTNRAQPFFDGLQAMARLDLDFAHTPTQSILDAMQVRGEFAEMSKEDAALLVAMARSNPKQMELLQLRTVAPAEKLSIIAELNNMRRMSRKQLQEMTAEIQRNQTERDLRNRLKRRYHRMAQSNRRLSEALEAKERDIAMLEDLSGTLHAEHDKWADLMDAQTFVDPSGDRQKWNLSLWEPYEGAPYQVPVGKDESGAFVWRSRELHMANPTRSQISQFNKDKTDLFAWLRDNPTLAGTKVYRDTERVFNQIMSVDLERRYPAAHRFFHEKIFVPTWKRFQQMGTVFGERVAQRGAGYNKDIRKHEAQAVGQSHIWSRTEATLAQAAGFRKISMFYDIVDPIIKAQIEAEPGLTLEQIMAKVEPKIRAKIPPSYKVAPDFRPQLLDYMERSVRVSELLNRINRDMGNVIEDTLDIPGMRLNAKEKGLATLFRKASKRGYAMFPRMLKDDIMRTVTQRMHEAGWGNAESLGAAINAAAEGDAGAIAPLFTPEVIDKFLVPLINKPGEPLFYDLDGLTIPQSIAQSAWKSADGDVMAWMNAMFDLAVQVEADGVEQGRKEFITQTLRRLRFLQGMVQNLSAVSESNPMEGGQSTSIPHFIMDARTNDLLPPDWVAYARFDPKSVRIMVHTMAYHANMGRGGEGLARDIIALRTELENKKKELDTLKQQADVEGLGHRQARKWMREQLGENGRQKLEQLERSTKYFHEINSQAKAISSYFSRGNEAGPFMDHRVLLEITGINAGLVLGQPKSGIKQFSSLIAQPLVLRGLSPASARVVARSALYGMKGLGGSYMRALGVNTGRLSQMDRILTRFIYQPEAQNLDYRTLKQGDTNIVYENGISGKILQASRWFRRMILDRRMQFRRETPEGEEWGYERAPVSMWAFPTFNAASQEGMAKGNLLEIGAMVSKAIRFYDSNPHLLRDTDYRLTAEDVGMGGKWIFSSANAYETYRVFLQEYGLGDFETFVRTVRDRHIANPKAELFTDDQVMRIVQMVLDKISLEPNIGTRAPWQFNSVPGQIGSILLGWGMSAMDQHNTAFKTVDGQKTMRSLLDASLTMAMWTLPAGIAFSLLLDLYDERVLDKRSNIRPVDWQALLPGGLLLQAAGVIGDKDPRQAVFAGLERLSVAGVYGMGLDFVNSMTNVVDPQAGQRDFSFDSRVLVFSQLRNIQSAITNWIHQEGDVTYATVIRPLAHTFFGNGIIQQQQIWGNLLDLDTQETRLVRRINSSNWLRAAAREHDIELRLGGGRTSPTPVSVRVREMQLAAYAGDRLSFLDNYRRAIRAEIRRSGDSYDEAQAAILRSFKARHPMIATFRRRPSESDIRQMLGSMSPAGRDAVLDVSRQHDRFTEYLEGMRSNSALPVAVGM